MIESCRRMMTSHPARRLALVFLCMPYIVSGVHKIIDPAAGAAEMSSYGLLPPAPYASVIVIIQLGCSALILTGFLRWIGALVLAIFTLVATTVAHPFWRPGSEDYVAMAQGFCEHLGLVGGLLLVTWYALHKYKNKGKDDWA